MATAKKTVVKAKAKKTAKPVKSAKPAKGARGIKPVTIVLAPPPKMPKGPLSAEERKKFKELLLARRRIISGDRDQMKEGALKGFEGDRVVRYEHPADTSSESFEQEFLLGIIQNEEEELRDIDLALERIRNNTFGVCEGCQKNVPKARLKAIPYARLCVECKRKEEGGEGPAN
ncbi:MAG: TraR/DksA C4-type zinc finger protein [Planctomycetota bacterium]